MYILSEKQKLLITQLADIDAQGINCAFGISETLGLSQVSNCIIEYTEFVIRKHGNLSVSSEYSTYILELSKKVDQKYEKNILNELIALKKCT